LSALTKIAVVLLVLASLLLSAATIAFVNKTEVFRENIDTAQAETQRERTAHNSTKQQVASLNLEQISQAQAANARESALKKERDDASAQILQLNAQITKSDQDKKAAETNAQTITAALKASQDQNTAYQAQVADLRKFRDQLVEERHSLNTQLTDALSKVAALETARKGAEEKAAGLQGKYDDLVARVEATGMKIAALPQRQAGGPALEGVVTSTFPAGGKPWASISLGSKDNVAKGMKFNIHNSQEFLGYLTIQSAEPTEAVGVLEGPGVDKIKPGDQVKTQLQ
jgi:hypothetical protein